MVFERHAETLNFSLKEELKTIHSNSTQVQQLMVKRSTLLKVCKLFKYTKVNQQNKVQLALLVNSAYDRTYLQSQY